MNSPLSRHEVQRDDRIVRALEQIADRLGRIAFLLERFVAPDEIGDEEEH